MEAADFVHKHLEQQVLLSSAFLHLNHDVRFSFHIKYLAVGQNLRYLFSGDYLLFKRLLRVTGGRGFDPQSFVSGGRIVGDYRGLQIRFKT